MHAERCAARATVRIAAAFLPRPEGRIMAEIWAADLDHADELSVDCGDIARGAVAFVVRRGPSAWCRRRWARATLTTAGLLASMTFIPPWFLVPVVALGLLVWLIAAPTDESRKAPRTSRHLL